MLFAAIVLVAGLSTRIFAQTSATVTGTSAGVKLIVPMTLTQDAPLHFGTINVLTGEGGTVVLPSNSTTRVFKGGVAPSAVAPLASNAAYHVTGTMNVTYALTLPSEIRVTETTLSKAEMTITNLRARFLGAESDAVTSTLSEKGTDSFTVGGTLTVPNSQMPGIYTGSFNVTVDYN